MKALKKIQKKVVFWLLSQYAKLLGGIQKTQAWKQYLKEKDDQEWKALTEAACSSFSDAEVSYAKPLIENIVWNLRTTGIAVDSTNLPLKPSVLLRIAVAQIKKMLVVRNIVGVQHLVSPVGLVYLMRLAKTENQPAAPIAPAFDAALADGQAIKLEIVKDTATAKTRQLQANFNIEAMQDLKALHGVDVEAEIESMFSSVISREIVHEVLNDLITLGTNNTISVEVPSPSETGLPLYVGDRQVYVGLTVGKAANEIARKTRRGPGNFIVTSPLMVSMLQSASKSVFAPAAKDQRMSMGDTDTIRFVGTLNGSIKVYCTISERLKDNILVGYKGSNGDVDTGYVYSPYVPLLASGVVMNPETFQPMIKLMTRYATTTFKETERSFGNSNDYYAIVDTSQVTNVGFL